MQIALNHLLLVHNHVIAQVIKAELVVGAESHVAAVGIFAFGKIHVVNNQPDAQAQKTVQPPHPFAVAFRKIIVDGNHVHALAFECVQINRQSCDERFALAGFHLSNFAFVQTHPANQLNVEMPHSQNSARRFPRYGKCFRQNIFERLAVTKAFAEFFSRAGEFIVSVILHRRFERVDFVHGLAHSPNFFFVVIAEKSLQKSKQILHSSAKNFSADNYSSFAEISTPRKFNGAVENFDILKKGEADNGKRERKFITSDHESGRKFGRSGLTVVEKRTAHGKKFRRRKIQRGTRQSHRAGNSAGTAKSSSRRNRRRSSARRFGKSRSASGTERNRAGCAATRNYF